MDLRGNLTKKQYQIRCNLGILVGFACNILLRVTPDAAGMGSLLLIVSIALVGTAAWIWGCTNYAWSKGQAGGWGLLGLIGCFGLLVLVFLKDRFGSPRRRRSHGMDDGEVVDVFE